MPRKLVITVVLIAALAGAGAITAYFKYQSANFVSTEDARVAADTVTITAQIPGKLNRWEVKEGSRVKANQIIGVQDISSLMTSSSISPAALGPAASVLAQKAEILAPIAGVVIQSKTMAGQIVAPGQPLAILADIGNLYVSVNIKETAIGKIQAGQRADVNFDALPDRTFEGVVGEIGQATASTFSLLPAQNSSGNYTKVVQLVPVRVEVSGLAGANLLPGMNARVRIHIAG